MPRFIVHRQAKPVCGRPKLDDWLMELDGARLCQKKTSRPPHWCLHTNIASGERASDERIAMRVRVFNNRQRTLRTTLYRPYLNFISQWQKQNGSATSAKPSFSRLNIWFTEWSATAFPMCWNLQTKTRTKSPRWFWSPSEDAEAVCSRSWMIPSQNLNMRLSPIP